MVSSGDAHGTIAQAGGWAGVGGGGLVRVPIVCTYLNAHRRVVHHHPPGVQDLCGQSRKPLAEPRLKLCRVSRRGGRQILEPRRGL
jgi:hypothetical protein